jgi:nitroreductase
MLELFKSRRSIRKFTDKVPEKEKLDAMLRAALMAPSSRGRRPWEFVVVTDRAKLEAMSRCREHGGEFLAGAPAAVVVTADAQATDMWVEDASIAAVFLQLAAHAQGLGSCWVQVRGREYAPGASSEDYIRELLGIPEPYAVECVVGVGHPAEDKPSHDEAALPYGKIHYERF